MKFQTAVWLDAATEQWCARIFPSFEGIDLAAWGLSGDVEPIDVASSSVRLLGHVIEGKLNELVPDFPMAKFEPVFLGKQPHGADIRALLESKLAAIAA